VNIMPGILEGMLAKLIVKPIMVFVFGTTAVAAAEANEFLATLMFIVSLGLGIWFFHDVTMAIRAFA
jgi:hypothetical protein